MSTSITSLTSGTTTIASYVSKLIDLERSEGVISLYEAKKESLTTKNTALSDLQTYLDDLNDELQDLSGAGTLCSLEARTVTSSSSSVATATATSSASSGTHSLFVSQLAKQSKVVSTQWTATGSDIASAAGTGSFTFQLGVGDEETDISVSVGEGDDNQTILENMAAAINDADAGVTATVVADTESSYRLVLTSDETGSANAIILSEETAGLLSATGASTDVAASGTTGGYMYATSELDAKFTLDGMAFTRSDNTVSDALTGVTIELLSTQDTDDSALTLKVKADASTITDEIQDFLTAYNTVIEYLNSKTDTEVDADTTGVSTTTVTTVTRGALADEPTYLRLLTNLRFDSTGEVSTTGSDVLQYLSDIGITADDTGVLSITDEDALDDAISDDPDAVIAMFNSDDGIATKMSERLADFVKTGGTIDQSLDTIETQLTNVNNSIESQEDVLDIRYNVLLTKYTALQSVISALTSQQTMLDSITSLTSS